jgi:serine protease SohB
VVCVDEIAASGGYLMAAVADTIVAAPFAVVGSIGVISYVPNISERLKREGVTVQEITAGEFKRSLTFFKPATEADRQQMQSEVNAVHSLFKQHLVKNRPGMDVQKLATGEAWYGDDAIKRGLVDQLCTSDEYILGLQSKGAVVYYVKVVPRGAWSFTQQIANVLKGSASSSSSTTMDIIKMVLGSVGK